MFFMHFDGKDAADRVVGDRLFQDGPPDCVVLATTAMPPPIGTQVLAWSKERFTNRKVTLPAEFITEFLRQTGYRFSPEVFLLERESTRP